MENRLNGIHGDSLTVILDEAKELNMSDIIVPSEENPINPLDYVKMKETKCMFCGVPYGIPHKDGCQELLRPKPKRSITQEYSNSTISKTASKEKPFSDIFEDRVNKCRVVLQSKSTEYAKNQNRYHNFDKAALRLDCTPEKALEGMMIKHFVSIQDIINDAENIHHAPPGVLNEKMTDMVNYIILLEGLLLRRLSKGGD